jgi:DNA-binding IscR family transcriptional regulator
LHNDREQPVVSGKLSRRRNIPLQMWEAFDLAQFSASLGASGVISSKAGRGGYAAFFRSATMISLSSNGLARWRNGVNMLGPTADAEPGGA